MNSIKIIYITNPSKEEAERLACHLLEKKLIACGNFFPVDSIYWWQASINKEHEYVLIAKTTEDNYTLVQKEVEAFHSYATSCIIGLSGQANDQYYAFIKNAVNA